MRKELDAAWAARQADLPFSTPYEALILASIVERETALADRSGRESPACSSSACAGRCACRQIRP